MKTAVVLLAILPLISCGTSTRGVPEPPPGSAPGAATGTAAQPGRPDAPSVQLIPPGYGTLRQDDIAIKIQLPGVQIRALPLDESVIRLLSADSYRALRDLVESRRDAVTELARRHNVREPSLWYVSFYGLEPEARFSPREIIIQSTGRDYRPLDIVPLSAGFGEQRLRQREVQSAILLFDQGINVDLPLTLTTEGVSSASWAASLREIERERAVIRSRAQRPNP